VINAAGIAFSRAQLPAVVVDAFGIRTRLYPSVSGALGAVASEMAEQVPVLCGIAPAVERVSVQTEIPAAVSSADWTFDGCFRIPFHWRLLFGPVGECSGIVRFKVAVHSIEMRSPLLPRVCGKRKAQRLDIGTTQSS
jgi:hypothetical protein